MRVLPAILKPPRSTFLLAIAVAAVLAAPQGERFAAAPWPRHTIDDSSSGADGVRVADVNSDGRPDLVTGWEEGGLTRVYLNPATEKLKEKWPAVTVGSTPDVEDAVLVDLDNDGSMDVVSSCEGSTRTVFVHWAPLSQDRYLDSASWTTEPIPETQDRTQWMFALPLDIDGAHGIDLVLGSKGEGAVIGWLESPANPRQLENWRFHELTPAGWIMSLIAADLDGDGNTDIVASDRKGTTSGVLWLEHPGADSLRGGWNVHRIGATGLEVMFMGIGKRGGGVPTEFFSAVKPGEVHRFLRPEQPTDLWPADRIEVDYPGGVGTAKAVRAGDLDLDGRIDVAYSCEGAHPPRHGVVWLRNQGPDKPVQWKVEDISGEDGIKFDRIELLDLDQDGDLDLVTSEENSGPDSRGLGLIWYENPVAKP